jgi:hypothetical protein
MFRTSYVYNQEDYIIHAALYVVFFMRLCKPSVRLNEVLDINARKTYHMKLHVQYSLPDDEHKMFETSRRPEELN